MSKDDNMNKKNSVTKYMMLYMSIGICMGVSGGLVFGMLIYPDNMLMGMLYGMPVGMCIGMAIGAAKDKRLSDKMMIIARIENLTGSSDVMIYTMDKNGEEKEYQVSRKKIKEEKFAVNDRVAEEMDGSLVSLESK